MPRITEYGVPESEGQAPMEVNSRPIEEAGQMGRAMQRFGADISQAEGEYNQRAGQEEAADAQLQGANLRASWSAKLNQQIQQGNVDTESMMQDYQQQVDDTSDKFSTPHGQLAFQRQASLTKGMLMRSAMNAKAKLAGAQAKANVQAGLDSDSSALFNDPSSFPAVMQANMSAIDDQVETGGLPASAADKIKHDYGVELAKSAVRGWAQLDPDKAEQLLMGTNNNGKGAFDQYFNGDVKSQMVGYINTVKSAKLTDQNRLDALEQKAKVAQAEAWKVKNIDKLEKGTLTADDILKAGHQGILGYDDMKEQLGMIDKMAKQESHSNPAVINSLTKRIYADENDPTRITNSSDIDKEAAKGNITVEDRSRLVRAIDETPDGKNMRVNRKQLYSFMEAQLVKKDSMIGMADPLGEKNLAQATQQLQSKEAEYTKAGKPLSELYDPNNKDSFYNSVLQFKLSPKDIMRANTNQMKMQSGAKSAVMGADKAQAILPRQSVGDQKESPADWISRVRSKKEDTK